jgi:hypothetical protein
MGITGILFYDAQQERKAVAAYFQKSHMGIWGGASRPNRL